MFVELMPLLKQRTLLITISRVGEKLKVNVIPAKLKDGEDQALTTPLSFTGSPEELDAELGKQLTSFVESHAELASTLAEAKAEMVAAAKAAERVKASQATKPDPSTEKKEDPAALVAAAAETTPSLFTTQPQVEEASAQAVEETGRTTTS